LHPFVGRRRDRWIVEGEHLDEGDERRRPGAYLADSGRAIVAAARGAKERERRCKKASCPLPCP